MVQVIGYKEVAKKDGVHLLHFVAAGEKLVKTTGIENIPIEDVTIEMGISNKTIYNSSSVKHSFSKQ